MKELLREWKSFLKETDGNSTAHLRELQSLLEKMKKDLEYDLYQAKNMVLDEYETTLRNLVLKYKGVTHDGFRLTGESQIIDQDLYIEVLDLENPKGEPDLINIEDML